MIVLDASAAVELLLQTTRGRAVASRIRPTAETVACPHLLDLEVVQVLRRYVQLELIPAQRAELAVIHLRQLDVDRHAHEPLLPRIWALRDNLTAYDASYVALAEVLQATLLTADAKLAAAPGHRASIELV